MIVCVRAQCAGRAGVWTRNSMRCKGNRTEQDGTRVCSCVRTSTTLKVGLQGSGGKAQQDRQHTHRVGRGGPACCAPLEGRPTRARSTGRPGGRGPGVWCVCGTYWYRFFPNPVLTRFLGPHSSHALISTNKAPLESSRFPLSRRSMGFYEILDLRSGKFYRSFRFLYQYRY